MSEEIFWGTGRRKTSIARVRLIKAKSETIKIEINHHSLDEYFPVILQKQTVLSALQITNTMGKYDIFVNVKGGGVNSQAGAILLGISRALKQAHPSTLEKLRDYGYLTRDSRKKERKKYGKRKARASYQFSKR